MIVKSYAKINIVLNVLGKHDDRFHEIDMVTLPIELHDSLSITKFNDSNSYVTFANTALGGDDNNLATSALKMMREGYNIKDNFRILINKVIPISAGLGGGSSNAAATLKAVNAISNCNLSDDELAKIGFKLGSDVPFFVYGKPARVSGGGEIVKPVKVKNTYYCLVVKPKKGLSTKEVYSLCDSVELKTYNIENVIKALEMGDDELLEKEIGNALETPALQLLPEINDIKNTLKELGFKIVLMSGSGSSVFALSTDKKFTKKVFKKLIKEQNDYGAIEMCKVIN